MSEFKGKDARDLILTSANYILYPNTVPGVLPTIPTDVLIFLGHLTELFGHPSVAGISAYAGVPVVARVPDVNVVLCCCRRPSFCWVQILRALISQQGSSIRL